MPTIPAGTKFHGVASTVDTKDRGSNNANNRREAYTIEDISSSTGGTLQVSTLTLQGTTSSTTSQAIYGINIIDTATTSNLATRLPDPTTGRQTTFVNNSTMSILVFPSVAGGKINGVVDGYASIPNDGKSYTFFCIQNPLPGAWTWSPPAVGQLQVPRISISHTNGAETIAYGVGRTAPFTGLAQIVNPQCPDPNTGIIGPCPFPDYPYNGNYFMAVGQTSGGPISFAGLGGEYLWFSEPNLTPKRTITATKVYSNFLPSDTPVSGQAPSIQRYMAQAWNGNSPNPGNGFFGNYWASKVYLEPNPPAPYVGGSGVVQGSLNSPVEIGDQGTLFAIQPANTVQNNVLLYDGAPAGTEVPTDFIGTGALIGFPSTPSPNFHSFGITIPADCATKTYEFDIFLEHT